MLSVSLMIGMHSVQGEMNAVMTSLPSKPGNKLKNQSSKAPFRLDLEDAISNFDAVPRRASLRPPKALMHSHSMDEVDATKMTDCWVKTPAVRGPARHSISGSEPTRRCIFSHYWKKAEGDTQLPNPDDQAHNGTFPLTSAAKRGLSKPTPANDFDIRLFSPPPDYHGALRKHFVNIDDFPGGEVPSSRTLPPLPPPLMRYASERTNQCGGMYPLISPRSILRRGKYASTAKCDSKRKDQNSTGSVAAREQNGNGNGRVSAEQAVKWSMTLSMRTGPGQLSQMQLANGKDNVLAKKNDNDQPKVQFDPRIVITEFEDNMERLWFTEDELNEFKYETIMLAQQYMLMNPLAAEEFNVPQINPITGKQKKKALFSLPILCSLTDIADIPKNKDHLNEVLENEVKKVLVVDPNKTVLEIFLKSIQHMFPKANISGVQTAEDALRLFTKDMGRNAHSAGQNGGFDIIIVDEKLCRFRPKAAAVNGSSDFMSSSLALKQASSFSHLQSLSQGQSGMEKQSSLSHLDIMSQSRNGSEKKCMSGSQLLKRICQLEDQWYGASRQGHNGISDNPKKEVATLSGPTYRRSLLIGVSINVDRDGQTLRDSGADIVWGKPPPRTGEALRNQLLSALVTKRQNASICVRFPQTAES